MKNCNRSLFTLLLSLMIVGVSHDASAESPTTCSQGSVEQSQAASPQDSCSIPPKTSQVKKAGTDLVLEGRRILDCMVSENITDASSVFDAFVKCKSGE